MSRETAASTNGVSAGILGRIADKGPRRHPYRLGLYEHERRDYARSYQGRDRLLRAEVVDAEVYVFVCLDNTSVVDGLNGTPPESSRDIYVRFKEIVATHEPGVIVKWIPGH
ncbi:hypothetical protein F5Y17DRAFT_437013, partial [Xylariaceae sp. FL0594]